MSRSHRQSYSPAIEAAAAREPRRRKGDAPSHAPMAFDAASAPATSAPPTRTWRSTVVGAAIGFGIVLALAMQWLMTWQIDNAQQRREQQKQLRAAASRCYEQASNAAVQACLKEVEARSAAVQP